MNRAIKLMLHTYSFPKLLQIAFKLYFVVVATCFFGCLFEFGQLAFIGAHLMPFDNLRTVKKRRLIVYCDESDSKGKFFSHFYGGAAVDETKINRISASLQEVYDGSNIHGEVKWTKIGPHYLESYCALMDRFFEHVALKEIKVRIMCQHNLYEHEGLDDYQKDNQYFLLYYQFIKHAFGFQHCNPNQDADTHIVLLLDELPANKERCDNLKDYLAGLSNFPLFRENRIVVPKDDIAEISSETHIISQCLDVVLGAMQFRLNDKHLEKPAGARRRGKRTIAKEKAYKHVLKRIRKIYPHFNIGVSTARPTLEHTWKHPYRHWVFRPHNARIDPKRGKNHTKGK